MTSTAGPARATADGRAAAGTFRRGPCYVYGIVGAAARVPAGLHGLGDPDGAVTVVPCRQIAAVTSGIPAGRPLGTPADLRAHASVLDALARSAAVLPMQFGGVMRDEDAVLTELLEPHHAAMAEHLDRLAGHAQFTVKGRYVGDAALREVLREEPEVMRLREQLRGRDIARCGGAGIRLGELVALALERKRAADARVLSDALAPHVSALCPAAGGPSSPDAAMNTAFLVARPDRRGFENAAQELGRRWHGRIRLRLLGPLPPYDFARPADRGE